MKKLEYTVRFVTPAFLGNAEQKGQWRTPPFKALLRQWWRVVKAKDFGYDYEKLREEEGKLFGAAHDEGGSSQRSRLLLRISEWNDGALKQWPKDPKVKHCEVDMGGGNVGAHLYLGYGPLTYEKGTGTVLKEKHPAIDVNESASLSVRCPDFMMKEIENAIKLINWFGAIGGRSRNGWGSLVLTGENAPNVIDSKIVKEFCQPLSDCLRLDWPHAIGKDEKGFLVWKTKASFSAWSEAMKALAGIKIDFRTEVSISENKDATDSKLDRRHILAYPVTNHGLGGWCEKDKHGNLRTDKRGKLIQGERLSSQLRFKVTQINGKYHCIAYHLPCSVPRELLGKLDQAEIAFIAKNQEEIWKVVHAKLDAQDSQMERIK